jgi:mRNA interferase RelE/StbE
MKVLYEKSFLKDLKKRKDNLLKERVESVITEIKRAEDRSELSNIEKLKGHDSAYKIRIGDYRMGLFIENDNIIFSRLLHRREIYKKFP